MKKPQTTSNAPFWAIFIVLVLVLWNHGYITQKSEIAEISSEPTQEFLRETNGFPPVPKDWCRGDIWHEKDWTGECPDSPSPFDVVWLGDTKAQVEARCKAEGGIYDERFNQDELKLWPICYVHDHYFKVHLPLNTEIGCTDSPLCYGKSIAPQ